MRVITPLLQKKVPSDDVTAQRLIVSGGETTSSADGAMITLHGSGSSTPRRAVYNALEHLFENGDVKPYLDNVNALGGQETGSRQFILAPILWLPVTEH